MGAGGRGGGGFGSVFENLFGGGGGGFGRSRGNDLLHECYITLEDVLHGKQIELDLKKFVDCPDCNGTGCKPGSSKSTCKDCGGYGQVRVRRNMGGMILESAQMLCSAHRAQDGQMVVGKSATGRKRTTYKHPNSNMDAILYFF